MAVRIQRSRSQQQQRLKLRADILRQAEKVETEKARLKSLRDQLKRT
jgi:hypothetical protein